MKKFSTSKDNLASIIAASSAGTLIEWYDFFIFGSLATIISTNFFPAENPVASFLATLAAFSAGLVVRPLGALIFGRLGDVIGRKRTFIITLAIMGISTIGMGLVPGFNAIGYWAPALVLLLRLLQGLALGGEYGGAVTYIAEHAPPGRRGFFTSWIQTTSGLAFILSIASILLIKSLMTEEAWLAWGWRVPFIASVLLIGVSVFIRSKMAESPLFMQAKAAGEISKNPLKESFLRKENLKIVLLAFFGLMIGVGTIGWITFYAQGFLLNTLHLDFAQANRIIIIGILAGTPFFILFGWLSDKIGRKVLLMAGMLISIIAFRPVFKTMHQIVDQPGTTQDIVRIIERTTPLEGKDAGGFSETTTTYIYSNGREETVSRHIASPETTTKTIKLPLLSEWEVILMVFVLQLTFTLAYGPLGAYMVELFPLKIRYTSISLPYHFGVGIFGGLAPYFATYLVSKASQSAGPEYYLAGLTYPFILNLIGLIIGLVYLKDTRRKYKLEIFKPRELNMARRWLGFIWIVMSVAVAWLGIVATGIPGLLSGNSEDIIFGAILTFIIVPALVLGLFVFGRYSLKGEYDEVSIKEE